MSIRSIIGLALLAMFSWAPAAHAGPGYAANSFAVKGADVGKLVAAFDKLGAAVVRLGTPGRALLLVNVADGTDPSTHTLVVLNPSVAAGESFFQGKLLKDPAWAEFVSTLSAIATSTVSARYQTLGSWGELSDADVVWESFPCTVTDVAAFLAAHDRFMNSATGKQAGGAQVHLVAFSAGGEAPFTHAIDVGWASEAEMEAWRDANANASNADWMAYQQAANAAGSCSNSTLSRVLSTSGVSTKAALGK